MKKIMYSFAICCMLHTGLYAQWKLTGNAGTTPGTNFLGTTDAKALMFKVNKQRSGYIDFDSTKANTSLGFQALKNSTGGINNAAFGYQALSSNTTGTYNTASGFQALFSNTTGFSNTASGVSALYHNTTGNYNTASGVYALLFNTSGNNNTALGASALYFNTTGYSNTAIGVNALQSNTTGYFNTASGVYALNSNTTGTGNTASGYQALSFNTTGNYNTASGLQALISNTTGSYNTASGHGALHVNTTGFGNTASGEDALYSNTTGSQNTATGWEALHLTNAARNSALGYAAGSTYQNGNWCTFVGAFADANAAGYTNSAAIGDEAIITASNQIMLGDAGVTVVRTYGTIIVPSDGRFKKNIKENVPGLLFINQLRPVTYNFDMQKLNDHIRGGASKDAQTNIKDAQAVANKGKIVYTGFVAQEVEQVADKLGYDFSGVYKPQNDKDVYGLSYSEFVVPLVKAMQELSATNDALKAKNEELEERLAKLESMVLSNSNNTVTGSSAYIKQNAPNPFNNSTVISYYTPTDAQIQITDIKGVTLKTYSINKGEGQLTIANSQFVAGTYNYTLYVGGKKIDSRQMVISR